VSITTLRVPSTDGVDLALHDFGGDGPSVLLCHATGFHGRAYLPFVRHLTSAYHVWALDFRAHGASTPPADEYFTWAGMAHDVLAAAAAVNEQDGTPGRALPGIGHSMGGAAILIAELSQPHTFEQAYLYEPIVFPAGWTRSEEQNSTMSGPARKRREVFGSRAEVMWRYASRPPLSELRSDCLAAYVEYGFDDLDDGTVRLACRAEHEARTFEAAGLLTSDGCAGVKIPVVVALGGADGDSNTAQMARPAAAALPHGRLKEYPHLGHFGPLQDPFTIAVEVRELFGASLS
jgi:pimeloyl-ACP methyl ester carboxylesterase